MHSLALRESLGEEPRKKSPQKRQIESGDEDDDDDDDDVDELTLTYDRYVNSPRDMRDRAFRKHMETRPDLQPQARRDFLSRFTTHDERVAEVARPYAELLAKSPRQRVIKVEEPITELKHVIQVGHYSELSKHLPFVTCVPNPAQGQFHLIVFLPHVEALNLDLGFLADQRQLAITLTRERPDDIDHMIIRATGATLDQLKPDKRLICTYIIDTEYPLSDAEPTGQSLDINSADLRVTRFTLNHIRPAKFTKL